MQHPDEGTIHAWLDGALTPEEAERVDAHVKECAQCQAAVSEARGFIAASSRILTALDDAPRGVIPTSVAPRRSAPPWIWRIAATVLVVATGTVLLVKDRASNRASRATGISDSTKLSRPSGTAAASAIVSPVAADSATSAGTLNLPKAMPAARANIPLPSGAVVRAAPRQDKSPATVGAVAGVERQPAVGRRANGAVGRADAAQALSAPAVAPTAAAPAVGGGAFRSLNARVSALPREVAVRHLVGKTQTLYEMSPGDTVVLEEQSSFPIEGALSATGATRMQSQPSPARKSAAATEAQQRSAAAPAPALPIAAAQDQADAGRHSISWLDPSSRRVVVLSGQHSQEELQRIREQIQRLRDAAQARRDPE